MEGKQKQTDCEWKSAGITIDVGWLSVLEKMNAVHQMFCKEKVRISSFSTQTVSYNDNRDSSTWFQKQQVAMIVSYIP